MQQTVKLQQPAHSDALNSSDIYVFYFCIFRSAHGALSPSPGSVLTPSAAAGPRGVLAYLGTRCGHFAHTQLHTGFGGLGWEGRAGGRPGSGE